MAAHLVAEKRNGARTLDVGDVEPGTLAQRDTRLDHALHKNEHVLLIEAVVREILMASFAHLVKSPLAQKVDEIVRSLDHAHPSHT